MNKQTHFRIMRQGVPYYVAPWVKTLSKQSQSELLWARTMTPYTPAFRKHLTKVEYVKHEVVRVEMVEPAVCLMAAE